MPKSAESLGPHLRLGALGLLSTKLHIPRPPAGCVKRSRLVDRLDEGLNRGVTLVCAPAGFGKSVLLADWCRQTQKTIGWLSLDVGDNDPVRFWRHIAAALDQGLDGSRSVVVEVVDALIRGPEVNSHEAVVTAMINVLSAQPDDVVLVLDDYHVVEEEEVHASVRFLLEHAPPRLRVALISRADPPLLLARARARGQLTELRETELRFTADEAAELLREATGSALPDEASSTLTARTEGWAAGLQLAGLSLRGHTDVAAFVAKFSGSHRFVLDYLTEEVLERQPPMIRDFLLQTSLLERLSGPLCDAVTGRTNSQALLEAAERANLFVVPLDDVRGWWRYHGLFADLLRVRLQQQSPELVRDLHRGAATWHDAHGSVDQAFHHALNAGEPEWATGVIERHADELLLRNEGATLHRWFAELPPGLRGSQRLLLAEARLAIYGGRVVDAEELLDAADQTLSTAIEVPFEPSVDRAASPLADLAPMAALLRAYVAHLRGDADEAEALASRTLDEINNERGALGLIARWHLATAPWLRGHVREAEAALTANIADWRAAHDHDRAASSAHHLGDVQRARGHLDAALATYEQVLTLDSAHTGPNAPAAGLAHIGIAEVAYQRNDLDAARHHASEGIAKCRQFVYTQALATGLSVLGRIEHAEAHPVAAREAIAEAARNAPSADVVDLLNPVPARRAQLLLAHGDVDAAASWAADRGLTADDEPSHAREPAYLSLARILLAKGRPDDALRLLGRLSAAAVADGRLGCLIEIEVLRALALAADGDEVGALNATAHAVALAAPQRHIRVFVDEGEPMAALLGQLVATPDTDSMVDGGVPLTFLGRLAQAFAGGADDVAPGSAATVQGLVVPLTDRELDVLRLIATGQQNKDIAADLYVSLNTVKKHVTHIFDKLGVTNRTAATDRARQLDILS